jgi:hypothetical protein
VAHGLHVHVASKTDLGTNIDAIALGGRPIPPSSSATNRRSLLPGVQRVGSRLQRGHHPDGTVACDPVRRTAWGTILVGEEAGSGGQ